MWMVSMNGFAYFDMGNRFSSIFVVFMNNPVYCRPISLSSMTNFHPKNCRTTDEGEDEHKGCHSVSFMISINSDRYMRTKL